MGGIKTGYSNLLYIFSQNDLTLPIMPGNEDWWGYLIFVFFIVVIMVFVIKIGLMFPGLFEWNFLCSDSEEENSEPDLEMEERDDAAAAGGDQESVRADR